MSKQHYRLILYYRKGRKDPCYTPHGPGCTGHDVTADLPGNGYCTREQVTEAYQNFLNEERVYWAELYWSWWASTVLIRYDIKHGNAIESKGE